MSAPAAHHPAAAPGERVYVPGYAGWKLALCACGVAAFCFGSWLLWPPLHLLIFGRHSQAVALYVVETKAGRPDLVLHNDADIQAHLGTQDDSGIFWNEFSLTADDGSVITVRDNVGSRLRPLYPLVDTEGLPTTATVCYDPRQPRSVIFPGEISTWLMPAVLTLAGLACAVISATLFYWANKPIELPVITASFAAIASSPDQEEIDRGIPDEI